MVFIFPPSYPTASGITLTWGSTTISATSISYSRSAPSEIDVTSMSSAVYADPENSSRKMVHKSVEYGVIDHGELTVEFFGPGRFGPTSIGQKKMLTVAGLDNAPSGIFAFLTSLSVQGKAGELITGTCTFRLSHT